MSNITREEYNKQPYHFGQGEDSRDEFNESKIVGNLLASSRATTPLAIVNS